MPELPEVQTTVDGLRKHVIGRRIDDAWSDYTSRFFKGSETLKDPGYFARFKKEIVGSTIISVERRAKNILINLTGDKTILVHMKMTGHLLYGTYEFDAKAKKDPWVPLSPEALKDPYNRHVHFVLVFDNGKQLALSDVRTFAKVTLLDSAKPHESLHVRDIGPEPLDKNFDIKKFNERIDKRPNGKIKQVLMDQAIIAGIGNIYADESLWRAGIHPLTQVKDVEPAKRAELFDAIQKTLARGIDFGGDSTSDYRNVLGEKGTFHEGHKVYQRTGTKCEKPGCKGIIQRIVLGGRGTHFCPVHQKLSKKK